jgi:hypothetical protein
MANDDGIAAEAVAQAVWPGLGTQLLRAAQVEEHPVPGTDASCVWLVRAVQLDHPMQAYVGRWPNGQVRLLTDDPEAWMDLIDAVGVSLDDAHVALAYVREFVEVTRGASVLVREVSGPEDLPWRPGSPAEEARRTAFLSNHDIEGPVAEQTAEGFHVELTLVVDQRIQRNMFDVGLDGRITASFRVIATDLPLPIAR